MTTRTSDLAAIQALIDDRHKKTLRLIEAIKTDTACLVHRTESLVEMEEEAEAEAEAEAEKAPRHTDFERLRKACVAEVMEQIQPLLDKLNDVIRDHRKHNPKADELDDARFAERMLEEMKSSASRRRHLLLSNGMRKPNIKE